MANRSESPHAVEELEDLPDRRKNVWRIEKSITVGNLLTIATLAASLIWAGVRLQEITRALLWEHNIMWKHFMIHEGELSPEEWKSLFEVPPKKD